MMAIKACAEFQQDGVPPRSEWTASAGALALAVVMVAGIGGCGNDDVREQEVPATSAVPDVSLQQPRMASPQPTLSKSLPSPAAEPSLPKTVAKLFEENEREAGRLTDSYPSDPDALEIKARMFFLCGENSAATECWKEALELNPRYAYAHCGLGQVAASRSKYEEAAAQFRECLAIAPQLSEAARGLSECLQKLGQTDEAIEVLENDLRVKPGSPETTVLLGFACLTDRRYEEAKEAFAAVLVRYPTFARAQFGLATALARLGRGEEARRAMERHRLLQLQSRDNASDKRGKVDDLQARLVDSSAMLSSVGRVYLAHGNLPEAERLLRRAEQFHSTGGTCALLSQVCSARGDRIGAIEAMQKAAEHEPGNEQYQQCLARLKQNI